MTSGRWFLGMNLGTILMETCFAPEGNMEKSRLCEARERATSSEPRAPEARATKKAVLYDNSSSRKWQDYVYIQCEYKSTKQKIKHLLREENKVKENKIS